MARIRVLAPHVVNQIAAGEVIERPASVVKELVENALDAGARRIEVRVQDGGRSLIEVADDGWGMDAEDLQQAFVAHATSKVEGVEDLRHVASLGFRGEALASIGSVSRAEIVTCARGAEGGWRLVDDHGVLGEPEPAGAAPGTVVRIEGLFARVPARRRFLRAAATELGHVSDWMARFAAAHPHVAFRLVQGERVLLDVPADQERAARLRAIHGDAVGEALLAVRAAEGDLTLEAWVGPPSLHRSDGRLEQHFLNGRFLRDRTVGHAIRQAYQGLLPPGGRRPVAFLFLTCDPAAVDVNVHPAKAEVRWRDTGPVHRLVRRALREVLEDVAPGVAVAFEGAAGSRVAEAVELAFTHPPRSARGALSDSPGSGTLHGPRGGTATVPGGASWTGERGAADGGGATLAREPASPAGDAGRPPGPVAAETRSPAEGLRPVGQALGTYLVLEGEDEIVLIDQHALHERILHDRIRDRLETEGALEVQRLLVPVIVDVGPAEASLLEEAEDLLARLGWVVEGFGDGSVAVRGLPAVLRRPDPEAALREVVEVLERGERGSLSRAGLLDDVVDRMACRAAVMAGDRLHADEVLALLEQAEALEHAHSCPHGRPTRLTLTKARLERWFHRTV